MGVPSNAHGLDAADGAEPVDPSVTAVGEPALIKTAALEINRGSVLAGRYQIEAVIGRGGSGIVLRAFDRVAQTLVALKVLKPELAGDPRWIERFTRELRLSRRIHHPNVCRVFDILQADGHWFITMELAPGGTLRDQLGEKAKERTLDQKLGDVRAVVAGLAAIHEAGIVHRDVKPDNFLRMGEGRLVLSDFGLATNPTEASTISIMVGTPSYMAPEVVMGQQATPPSDVWSLGVVLHEVLFGERPEWTRRAQEGFVIRQPRRVLSAQERALEAFVEECLQTDPSARPANAVVARSMCERALSGQRSIRSRHRGRRPQWLWPAVAAVGAVVVGLASGRLWHRASAFSGTRQAAATPSVHGAAQDWTQSTRVVASFEGHVHCMTWLEPDRSLRVIVGSPRRAFDVDVATEKAVPSPLPPRTFALGCPQRSRKGELLFEAVDENGRGEILLAQTEANVSHAKVITHGSEPLWLPSGDEFIYSVDDAHAALFSLPVMSTNIVSDGPADQGLLAGKAVSEDGRLLALRYYDVDRQRHVILHALPSLAVVQRATFADVIKDFAFIGASNGLAFSTESENGDVLAQVDERFDDARRLGGVPGRHVAMPTVGRTRWAFAAKRLDSDVWSVALGRRSERLTNDGQSYYPDLSSRGDLIVEHRELDGREVIRLFPKGAEPRDVSRGVKDMTPTFLPDGRGWLYVDGERRAIRQCTLGGECSDVAVPGDFPLLPVASPDGERVAYLTAVDREMLKIVDRNGNVREVGPARAKCRPYWTANNRIWVVQGSDVRPVWAELDANTGERVNVLAVNEALRYEFNGCGLPDGAAPPGVLFPPKVAARSSEASEIRVLAR